MSEIDLRALDLNLLVVLDVLLEERSVSRAAVRIGRTQSATSHALGRLRDQLQDPLLVRVGDGMQPTPRAERLAGELRRVLRALTRVLEDEDDFDPAVTERTFSLAGPDFLAAQLPAIVGRLREVAPRARLDFTPPSAQMQRALVDGQLDLVVGPPPARPMPGVDAEPLVDMDWVVFAAAGHPATRRWGIRAWAKYPHVRIRTASDRAPVDVAAADRGYSRHIGAYLPSFQAAAALVAHTDMLLTAPRAVLGDLVERYDLRTLDCPLELEPVSLSLQRASHLSMDPAIALFAEAVRSGFE